MLFGTCCGCQPALFSLSLILCFSLKSWYECTHAHLKTERTEKKSESRLFFARLGTGTICIIAFDKNALPIKYHSSLNCLGFNKLSYFHISNLTGCSCGGNLNVFQSSLSTRARRGSHLSRGAKRRGRTHFYPA